jgi:hypothetical protein
VPVGRHAEAACRLHCAHCARRQGSGEEDRALNLLKDWKPLLGQHTATSRQLLRKLLGPERFVFYPKGKGDAGWYDLGVTPTPEKFLEALPVAKKLWRPQCVSQLEPDRLLDPPN